MTSTQAQVEVAYNVSNEFFRLWLDERMHYTCALFESERDTLEQAQQNKARALYEYAEVAPGKRVLDIGCGWGANLEYLAARGVREIHGITLSRAQCDEIERRRIPGVRVTCADYRDFVPDQPFDALQSIEMIDHLCSPAQAAQGLAVEIYRAYFERCASWVRPGACFGFQAILRNRVPRNRADLEDLRFTADAIFPGGLNPRLEELCAAVNPHWEIVECRTLREHYQKTTAEWLRRLRQNEARIRERWSAQLFADYDRYLSTCVRAFASHWSSDVQMKLRRMSDPQPPGWRRPVAVLKQCVAAVSGIANAHPITVAALALCALCAGCGVLTPDSARDVRVGKHEDGKPVTQVEVQQDVQRFAGQFIDRVGQAFDPLAGDPQPKRREAALRLGVAYWSSALDIAAGPYPEINLVDMIVFVTLSGDALENHWVPTTFGDEGLELVHAFRKSEDSLWAIADKVLGEDIQNTVRNLIVDWQAKHPGQWKVESVRFNEFAERAGEVSAERQSQARGIFGQVKQATKAADQALLLGERGMFVANHMPSLIRLQARLGVYETTSDALSRLDNAQALVDQLPELRPLLEQSTALVQDATVTLRESEELATAWRPYLDWLSDRHAGGEPVSLYDTLESANRLTDTSLALVREVKGAAPKDGAAMLDKVEARLDRIAKRGLVYLILLGLAWSVLFWGGYFVVKRLAG